MSYYFYLARQELNLIYSALIRAPAVVFVDPAIDAIRMVPPARHPQFTVPNLNPSGTSSFASINGNPTNDASINTAVNPTKKTQSEKDKVPRPPNAFILYRQHHHPVLKRANPMMHNNEICMLIPLYLLRLETDNT